MARRSIWAALLVGAALAGGTMLAPPSAEAQQFQFKYTDYNPPGTFITDEIIRWSKEVVDKSAGRIKIDVFPSSQMGPWLLRTLYLSGHYGMVRAGGTSRPRRAT